MNEKIKSYTIQNWPKGKKYSDGVYFSDLVNSKFEKPSFIFLKDNWNDYNMITQFTVYYSNSNSEKIIYLGSVKIVDKNSKWIKTEMSRYQ